MRLTREDVGKLLAYIQSFDKRTVGPTDALAWYDVLPLEIPVETYRAAIRKHYQRTADMMMPAQLIQLARLETPVREKSVGQPGEIICRQCHGVHFPHESCDVLITIHEYGIGRFWAEVDRARAEKGWGPLPRKRKATLGAAIGVPVAEPETRAEREARAMPQPFRDAVQERTGIDPGDLFKLPADVTDPDDDAGF